MKKLHTPLLILALAAAALPPTAYAQSFSGLYSMPLIGNVSAAPLILMTMQRDSRLFVEAYDDASDINGDGVMDTRYNPELKEYDPVAKAYKTNILDYYGYFDPYKCYEYKDYAYGSGGSAGTLKAFVPIGDTDTGTKKCTSYSKSGLTSPWSGDFLNYMTTTRIDALRKVLYGGKRYLDLTYVSGKKTSHTVLERANIPQDLHAYGKEYTSTTVDGYDIADYTPLSQPTAGKRHLFANVTLGSTAANNPPLLRILTNRGERAWDWIAAETSAVADTPLNGTAVTPTNLNVRVVVCDTSGDDDQTPNKGADANGYCKTYGQNKKPVGILHDFGEQNSVYFGLLTGTSVKNFNGGMLRKAISSFTDEVDASTGIFSTSVKGMVYTIDRLQVRPFSGAGGGAYSSKTGESSSSNTVGNPVAEMMYEGLRYLAGATRTTDYWDGTALSGGLTQNEDPKLPAVLSWTNPYGGSGFNVCAKPTQMVISDVNPTFDSDKLPGSLWASGASFAGTFGPATNQLDVAALAGQIWTSEGWTTKNIITGEKYGGSEAGLPTVKSGVTSFAQIRGLVPEDPMWQGSFYAASVAKYGKETDLKTLGNPAFASSSITNRVVNTSVVALSSALPRIEMKVSLAGSDQLVTVVPYAQTNAGGNWAFAEFVKVFVDNIKNVTGAVQDPAINGGFPYYKMQVVFSDNSLYRNNGHDNDMDSRATYEVYWDDAAKKVVVNVCADPYPESQTSGGLTSVAQTIRCNRDGVDGIGYSATGVRGMHLGYSISGVQIPTGEQATRLVVRNNAYNTGNDGVTDLAHSLDLASARISGNFVDNYFNSGNNSSAGLVTMKTAADGNSLRLNHAASYDLGMSINAGEFIPHDPLWYAAKYGGYLDGKGNTTPNLQLDGDEWKGTDGITPNSYFRVVNPALLKEQITQAITPTLVSGSSFAATASNSTDLKTLNAVYQGKYIAAYWSGRLSAYTINTNTGTVDTTTPLWEASSSSVLPSAATRNIYTYRQSTSAGIAFKWTTLDTTEKGKLGNQSSQLDYIRGDRTNEGTGTTNFRKRDVDTVLGDIINSQPIFAGDEDQGYGSLSGTEGSSYAAYVTSTKKSPSRSKMIYVGANDGMLHGFRASDGVELLAYIPRATLWGDNASQLSLLTSKSYAHKYYVDGPLVVNDFYDGSNWKTALVGTLGAGGKAVFALDVTNPDSFTASNVMWEFSHPELGHVRNQPIIARLNDGNWYAIVGNGLESSTCDSSQTPRYTATNSSAPRPFCTQDLASTARNAKLFIIKLKPDLSNGWTLGSDYFVIHATDDQTATTPPSITTSGSSTVYDNGTDNGLSGPAIKDRATTAVSYVYAGDLQGNVWKFDLSDATPSAWTTAYKLFQAKDSSGNTQPITSAVAAGTNPKNANNVCVAAGTGRFVYEGDLVYKGVQSAYGVQDTGSALTGTRSSELQEYTVTDKRTETYGGITSNLVYVSDEAFDATKKGWFLDLREKPTAVPRDIGERIIQAPILTKLRTNELLATYITSIPTGDQCDASGSSFMLDFNACTGEALSIPTFDLDGNLVFDSADRGTPGTGERNAGRQVGAPDASNPNSAMCFESATGGMKGCSFDLGILSCSDGRIETIRKPPTSTSCGIKRTSWRQLR